MPRLLEEDGYCGNLQAAAYVTWWVLAGLAAAARSTSCSRAKADWSLSGCGFAAQPWVTRSELEPVSSVPLVLPFLDPGLRRCRVQLLPGAARASARRCAKLWHPSEARAAKKGRSRSQARSEPALAYQDSQSAGRRRSGIIKILFGAADSLWGCEVKRAFLPWSLRTQSCWERWARQGHAANRGKPGSRHCSGSGLDLVRCWSQSCAVPLCSGEALFGSRVETSCGPYGGKAGRKG